MDIQTIQLLGATAIALILTTVALALLGRFGDQHVDPAVLATLKSRVRAWWLLFGSLACAFLLHPIVTLILFALIAFFAFREYLTIVPTRLADHQTLFWGGLLCIPVQFTLVGLDPLWFHEHFRLHPYLVFSILIPAYVFLLIPAWIAMSNDPKRFLERIAKIQVGLLFCVYCLSHVPALLTMDIPGPEYEEPTVASPMIGQLLELETTAENQPLTDAEETTVATSPSSAKPIPRPAGQKMRLLFFFVLIVQLSDLLQYIASQWSRAKAIAPTINSSRTWSGVFGGAGATALIALALSSVTPYPLWWQPVLLAFIVSLMGFAGSMTMSAIKRDRGVDDYGTLIEGHGGILDRLDSLCFAAPVFYHLTWIFLHFE